MYSNIIFMKKILENIKKQDFFIIKMKDLVFLFSDEMHQVASLHTCEAGVPHVPVR